jgi:hypothetical protein
MIYTTGRMDTDGMIEKVVAVKRTRTLKDGTVKSYMTVATRRVKNGVNDKRKLGLGGPPEKLSDEQKATIRARYADGVSVKRLCDDYNVCFATISRVVNDENN